MTHPNRTIARIREAARKASLRNESQVAETARRIAAGEAVRAKTSLTKNFGISSWEASAVAMGSNPYSDEAWNETLVSVGTSLADWMSRVNRYYAHDPMRTEKQRKVEGKALDAYIDETRTKVLAPHARKIADAYAASCAERGVEWTLVADPNYGLKQIYPTGGWDDAAVLVGIVDRYLWDNTHGYRKSKNNPNRNNLHRLAVSIIRWVIETRPNP